MPEGITHVELPPTSNKIVLWGTDSGHLVVTDVVECDDNAYFLWSERKVNYYNEPDPKARQPFVDLIHRIDQGKETSVTVEAPSEPHVAPTERAHTTAK